MKRMEIQNELKPGLLLDEEGNLAEAGYAFSLIKEYKKDMVKGGKNRLKEWDYYYVGNKDYGIALTVANNSYMGMLSLSILDFKRPSDITKSIMMAFPGKKITLPETSKEGDVKVEDEKKGYSFAFLNEGKGKRRLLVYVRNVDKKGNAFHCDISLEERNEGSLVIATPFKKKGHFYYNQKINNLKANGYAKYGDKFLDFNSSSYGVLDWGRGVWTYKNTWYWSSLSCEQDGHLIGWNLGYGFGDTSKASENVFFYDGKPHKLGKVRFDIPISPKGGDEFMKEWSFYFADDSFELRFKPIYNRHSDTNVGLIRSNQNQVFGLFSGSILLDGKPVSFHDLPGFAEKVFNKW